MLSATFIIFIVSEKIATLKFFPHTDVRPTGGWPKTGHYTDSHLSWESKTLFLPPSQSLTRLSVNTSFYAKRLFLCALETAKIGHHLRILVLLLL